MVGATAPHVRLFPTNVLDYVFISAAVSEDRCWMLLLVLGKGSYTAVAVFYVLPAALIPVELIDQVVWALAQ